MSLTRTCELPALADTWHSWNIVLLGVPLSQVERKMDLIYGGGSIGLMGLVSQTVFDGGCNVLGWENQHNGIISYGKTLQNLDIVVGVVTSFSEVAEVTSFEVDGFIKFSYFRLLVTVAHWMFFMCFWRQDHSSSPASARGNRVLNLLLSLLHLDC